MQAVLKKVDGAVVLSLPQEFLQELNLSGKSAVDLSLEEGCLIVKPAARSKYTLDELLAQSDYAAPLSDEERQWIDAIAVGKEFF